MTTSPNPTAPTSTGWGGLARYVTSATLARTADGGAVVAIVLLVTSRGGPGWLAGTLGACITAPHLLGPFVARRLDTARDGRQVIAVACLLHGATLAAAVLLYPVTHPTVTALLLMASGLVGPLLPAASAAAYRPSPGPPAPSNAAHRAGTSRPTASAAPSAPPSSPPSRHGPRHWRPRWRWPGARSSPRHSFCCCRTHRPPRTPTTSRARHAPSR
ncbi:hypothetical protein [Qaidamihabitans albus]|uniref:hypothetical protein n=1 Tax=Qaidamihabitans albus TaxID=2795733 RepID=UPI0018F1FD9C|nr:hypothetical protein [Qaidamihabitans albus]